MVEKNIAKGIFFSALFTMAKDSYRKGEVPESKDRNNGEYWTENLCQETEPQPNKWMILIAE